MSWFPSFIKSLSANLDKYIIKAYTEIYGFTFRERLEECNDVLCVTKTATVQGLKEAGKTNDKYIAVVFPTELISKPEFLSDVSGVDVVIVVGMKWSLAANGPAIFGRQPVIKANTSLFQDFKLYVNEPSEEGIIYTIDARLLSDDYVPMAELCATGKCFDVINSRETARKVIKIANEFTKHAPNGYEHMLEYVEYLPEALQGLYISLEYYYRDETKAAERVHKLIDWIYDAVASSKGLSDEQAEAIEELLGYGFTSYYGGFKEYKYLGETIEELINKIIKNESVQFH